MGSGVRDEGDIETSGPELVDDGVTRPLGAGVCQGLRTFHVPRVPQLAAHCGPLEEVQQGSLLDIAEPLKVDHLRLLGAPPWVPAEQCLDVLHCCRGVVRVDAWKAIVNAFGHAFTWPVIEERGLCRSELDGCHQGCR